MYARMCRSCTSSCQAYFKHAKKAPQMSSYHILESLRYVMNQEVFRSGVWIRCSLRNGYERCTPLHTGNCKTSLLLREEWIQIEIRRCPEQRLGIEVRYTSSRLIVLIRVINDCVLEDFATDMCMLDHENLEDDILELLENQNTLPYGCSHKYPTEWLLKIILRTANCNDHYDPPHNLDMSSASAKIQSFHLQWCF